MSTLYLECNSGISGDMAVAALIDAGANAEELKRVLKTLPVEGFDIKISRVKKAGLDCADFDVVLDKEHENHDHDMDYLYGHEHDHEHDHDHEHGHHHHHHAHTNLPEIYHIIDHADLTSNANAIAKKIFHILAEAESKAHGVPMEEVHFHEVGAVDSIVDIVAAAFCIDDLKLDKVIVPKVCEGTGTVRCQHGILSVPVPAVTNIAQMYDLPLEITNRKGELITPTGAAIVAAIKTDDVLPTGMKIKKCGMGAGKREYEIPSIVRAMIIEENKTDNDVIYKLESNIDDCTGEALGYVLTRLMDAGARDAHFHPVFMKKNRPAWQLNVICSADKKEELENIIFAETTTIGIRSIKMERTVLKRSALTIHTELGDADIKVVELNDGKRFYPEYESIVKICKEKNMSYNEVYTYLAAFAKGESN